MVTEFSSMHQTERNLVGGGGSTKGARCNSLICIAYLFSVIASAIVGPGFYLWHQYRNIYFLALPCVGVTLILIGSCVYRIGWTQLHQRSSPRHRRHDHAGGRKRRGVIESQLFESHLSLNMLPQCFSNISNAHFANNFTSSNTGSSTSRRLQSTTTISSDQRALILPIENDRTAIDDGANERSYASDRTGQIEMSINGDHNYSKANSTNNTPEADEETLPAVTPNTATTVRRDHIEAINPVCELIPQQCSIEDQHSSSREIEIEPARCSPLSEDIQSCLLLSPTTETESANEATNELDLENQNAVVENEDAANLDSENDDTNQIASDCNARNDDAMHSDHVASTESLISVHDPSDDDDVTSESLNRAPPTYDEVIDLDIDNIYRTL